MITPRQRGFSLIEIVIVLFLTGIMLFCVANLTDRTLKTMKFLQEKSSTLESATLACKRLGSELRETITLPDVSPPVTFVKVIPSAAPYVDNATRPDPADWLRSYPASQRATITYRTTSDSKVTRQVNSEAAIVLANDVNAFDVSKVDLDGIYRIKLTILEDRRAVTFESVVVCPGVKR